MENITWITYYDCFSFCLHGKCVERQFPNKCMEEQLNLIDMSITSTKSSRRCLASFRIFLDSFTNQRPFREPKLLVPTIHIRVYIYIYETWSIFQGYVRGHTSKISPEIWS